MNNTTTISRTRAGGVTLTTTQENYTRLSAATLPACPFKSYFALDLLRDLFAMYDYLIPYVTSTDLQDFLKATNDAHAAAYMEILTGVA